MNHRPALVRTAVTTVLALGALWPSEAHATLDDEARQLVTDWQGAGMSVERARPVFVEVGRVKVVSVPGARKLVDDTGGARMNECLSVAFLGHRSLDFTARVGRSIEERRSASEPPRSRGGVITLTRCGEGRRDLEDVVLEAKSGRGSIEVILARGRGGVPSPSLTLPERIMPPPAPMVDPGRAPQTEALAPRVARVADRAKAEGAASVMQSQSRASDDGNGKMTLQLRAGCHRLELLADTSQAKRAVDVDAELRNALDRVIGRDRSETMDGRVESCVGERTPVQLAFAGAPPRADLTLVDSMWEIPPGVPEEFGPRLRASMARSLLHRKVRTLPSHPMFKAIGVAGSTAIPFEVEPGSCYLATVATYRGDPRIVQLSVRAGNNRAHDDGAITLEGSALSFCTSDTDRATATIDARGNSLAWALFVWRTSDASREETLR